MKKFMTLILILAATLIATSTSFAAKTVDTREQAIAKINAYYHLGSDALARLKAEAPRYEMMYPVEMARGYALAKKLNTKSGFTVYQEILIANVHLSAPRGCSWAAVGTAKDSADTQMQGLDDNLFKVSALYALDHPKTIIAGPMKITKGMKVTMKGNKKIISIGSTKKSTTSSAIKTTKPIPASNIKK